MPRLSPAPVDQEEWTRMMAQAKDAGYLSDNRRVKNSLTEKRFLVKSAFVCNTQKAG